MADENPTNIIDFLRGRFDRVDTQLAELRRHDQEMLSRFTRLEREVAATRREIAGLHQDWVDLSHRLDNFADRLERIERRLDLVD